MKNSDCYSILDKNKIQFWSEVVDLRNIYTEKLRKFSTVQAKIMEKSTCAEKLRKFSPLQAKLEGKKSLKLKHPKVLFVVIKFYFVFKYLIFSKSFFKYLLTMCFLRI